MWWEGGNDNPRFRQCTAGAENICENSAETRPQKRHCSPDDVLCVTDVTSLYILYIIILHLGFCFFPPKLCVNKKCIYLLSMGRYSPATWPSKGSETCNSLPFPFRSIRIPKLISGRIIIWQHDIYYNCLCTATYI